MFEKAYYGEVLNFIWGKSELLKMVAFKGKSTQKMSLQ